MDITTINFSNWSQLLSEAADQDTLAYIAYQKDATGTIQKIKTFIDKQQMLNEGYFQMSFSTMETLTNRFKGNADLIDANKVVSSLQKIADRKTQKVLKAQSKTHSSALAVFKFIAAALSLIAIGIPIYLGIHYWQKNVRAQVDIHQREINALNDFANQFKKNLNTQNFIHQALQLSGEATQEEIEEQLLSDWMNTPGCESRENILDTLRTTLMRNEEFTRCCDNIAKFALRARSMDTKTTFSSSSKTELSTLILGAVDLYYKDFRRDAAFELISDSKVSAFRISKNALTSTFEERKILSFARNLSWLCDHLSQTERDAIWFKVIQTLATQRMLLFNTFKLLSTLQSLCVEYNCSMKQERLPTKITLVRNPKNQEIQALQVNYLLRAVALDENKIPFLQATAQSHFTVIINEHRKFEIPPSSISRTFDYIVL